MNINISSRIRLSQRQIQYLLGPFTLKRRRGIHDTCSHRAFCRFGRWYVASWGALALIANNWRRRQRRWAHCMFIIHTLEGCSRIRENILYWWCHGERLFGLFRVQRKVCSMFTVVFNNHDAKCSRRVHSSMQLLNSSWKNMVHNAVGTGPHRCNVQYPLRQTLHRKQQLRYVREEKSDAMCEAQANTELIARNQRQDHVQRASITNRRFRTNCIPYSERTETVHCVHK